MSTDGLNQVPPDKDVSRGRTYLKPWARLALAGGVSAVVLGGIGWMLLPHAPRAPLPQKFSHTEGRPWATPPIPVAYKLPSPIKTPPPEAPKPTTDAVVTEPPAQPMGFYENASVTQSVQQAASQRAQQASRASGLSGAEASRESPQDAGTDVAQRRAGVARATVGKPFNLHYLLRRDTIFHCVPEQPLDSDVPGPIGCTVAEDVMSADGSVVLIEKGSTVDGEVTRAPTNGTNRMFVEFDEILTLSGIPIYLSGTGGDTLGTSGVDGAVNDHLWRKIRAALMLSVVEVAGQVAENQSQRAGNLNLNVGGSGESMAQMMLAHDINIPPTIYRNQADPITVTVRQDIPMDDAYKLVAMGGTQ